MENFYSNFKRLYPVQKTLRFELKPIGKTIENMQKNGIITRDEKRAIYYKNVKKYCDEYHKYFITQILKKTNIDGLEEFYNLYCIENKTDEQKEKIKNIEKKMREQISNSFKKNETYKGLMSKEMIKYYLVDHYKGNEEVLKEIKEFENFTTYFNGYNKNRENMYVKDEKSTAIAYRLIDENLHIFASNVRLFKKLSIILQSQIKQLSQELIEYIQVVNINEMFEINFYNDVLTQTEIENYNLMISGKTLEDGRKIKGLNEYINEYNQKQESKNRIPRFKELYKQILSDKSTDSFKFDIINNDKELIELIDNYYKDLIDTLKNKENSIVYLFNNIDNYNLEQIYIENSEITDFSVKIFDDWNYINSCIYNDYDCHYTGKKNKESEKYREERRNEIKKRLFSIKYIDSITNKENKVKNYIKNFFKNEGNLNTLEEFYLNYEKIRDEFNKTERNLLKDENAIEIIKNLLDSIKSVQEFIKSFVPKDEYIEQDEVFYNDLIESYDVIIEINALYNKVRNYLTQKPYSSEKIKINFDCSTLLGGWDLNKEKDNLGIILKKDDKYYLGIIDKRNKKIFECTEEKSEDFYYKMEYKQLGDISKQMPRIAFAKSREKDFHPTEEIKRNYELGKHKVGENFDLNYCHELIDYFKKVLKTNEDWKVFDFNFSETNLYNNISDFYKEVDSQMYSLKFKKINAEYINELVEDGKLSLFQIYNKDFSKYSKGKNNLHTMYWKALFDKENLKDVVYKLNGNAEIFYRKASLKIEDTAVHKANLPINNKNIDTINKGKTTSVFNYDLIKNKRYTEDKFYLHVPIVMNYNSEGISNINGIVNKYIKYNDDIYVIGIDRGERNLLYLCVIDSNGKIVEQKSLNEIINQYNGTEYKTDYHRLLDEKEKEREYARENWKNIENIKELKEGYISQVIYTITKLMEKYNSIIVLEDLNKGFKNSRIKVEKQVYQKFEKKLIDKLNYLVFKENNCHENGGVYNAYQLTNQFDSFKKLGKQSGVLFYIPAWNTSKIDPTTGFVNLFYIKKNENNENSRNFIKNIDDIRYNEVENYFEFDIDYSKFGGRYENTKRKWTICSYGERLISHEKNNKWENISINLTLEFKKLLEEYEISFKSIKQDILKNEKFNCKKFVQLFKYMVQMRNSVIGENEDYLISPVKNDEGYFYNSKNAVDILPKDADANGAYNIARKGLMLVQQIKNTEDEDLNKIKYSITNEEWLNYAQHKENM